MRNTRTCMSGNFNTGVSKCPVNLDNIKAAILVRKGVKLPKALTAEKLEELAHADGNERIYGILPFVEYAKNGGEVQTSAIGYGAEQETGVSAQKDTFTLDRYYPELDAALSANENKAYDVYYVDDANTLIGINDGTEELAGIPMACVYSDATQFNTSGAKATMTVTFCHTNSKILKRKFDYAALDFDVQGLILGLTAVELVKAEGNEYKIVEKVGGYDLTALYGSLIKEGGSAVLVGTTSSVSYNEDKETLTITSTDQSEPKLAKPSVLFTKGIKGIEQL